MLCSSSTAHAKAPANSTDPSAPTHLLHSAAPEDLSCFISFNYPSALRNSDSLLLPKAKVVEVEDERPSATHPGTTTVCGSASLAALAGELRQCDSPAALTCATLLPASRAIGLVVMCTAWGASLESKILTAINMLFVNFSRVRTFIIGFCLPEFSSLLIPGKDARLLEVTLDPTEQTAGPSNLTKLIRFSFPCPLTMFCPYAE